MSWQCPICETVNQDATPVCTVCDSIAPVIESYLALEAIDSASLYNSKLDEIHAFEAAGKFEEMLNVSMEAIAIYKENRLAINKAKSALSHICESNLRSKILTILKDAADRKEDALVSSLFSILDSLSFDVRELNSIRVEVETRRHQENYISEILQNAYKSIIDFDLAKATELIEEGLIKYPSSTSLQERRTDIKHLKCAIQNIKTSENKKRPYPKAPQRAPILQHNPDEESQSPSDKSIKRKYPTIKRNMSN